jgi:outer membrane protein assembly factor BamB
MRKKILIWAGAILFFSPHWIFADWPNHRGDASLSGVSSGVLETELSLEWTFDAGKFLKSSPVVSGNFVFLGGSTGNFYALDRVTGKEVWKKNIGVGVDAPALIQEGRVYVGTKDGFMVCLDAQTGENKWSYETMGEIVGSPNIAAHPEDGRLLLLVGSYDNFIHCLDAKDGKLLWKFETMNYINGTPAIWGKEAVVFGGCDAQLYVISLLDGQLIRQADLGAPIASSVGLIDRFGYVGNMDKSVQAIDLTTGQIVWTYEPKNFPYFSSPALTDEWVIIGGRDKGLHGINRKTGSMVWRYAARGRIDSSPVIVGEKVVVGTMDGKLCLIRLNSGELITEYEIGASISSTCAVSNGWIFVGCEDGTLYTFSTKSP